MQILNMCQDILLFPRIRESFPCSTGRSLYRKRRNLLTETIMRVSSNMPYSFSLPVSSLAHDCLFRIALSSKYWVLVSKKTSKYAKKILPK